MKKMQILFICLLLGLLVMPWFNLPQPNVSGAEKQTALPSFSWKTYWTGNFQKQFESWWNGHFGSRRTMLIVKNDIYEVLNLGQFHSGYSGNILQGRHGILYEQSYLVSKFEPYNPAQVQKLAEKTVDTFSELRDRLEFMGKSFLFVMAPSKADAREDALPRLWQFRARHTTTPSSLYSLWERTLSAQDIVYVNALDVLKKAEILNDSFPDTGTHWSMLAAGLAWEEGVRRIKAAGFDVPAVHVTGKWSSDKDNAVERDIANLLNIYPLYHRGRPTWSLAEYRHDPLAKTMNVISIGDSFSKQLYQNILRSGFSTSESSTKFENRMPTKENWFDLLEKSDLLVLTYTYPKLRHARMLDEAAKLLAYTTDIMLEDWYPYETRGKGQWSRQHSRIAFFHSRDTDHELSFLLKSCFHSEKLKLSVNGHDLTTFNLKSLNLPRKISVTIPKIYLEKGLNHIEFYVEGATSPYCVTKNSKDSRVIGVYCSDFSIRENNMYNSITP